MEESFSPALPPGHTLDELLVRSSRTFAVGIQLLSHPLRHEITVAYLLLRVSDYLEDNEERGAEEKASLLHDWEQVLAGRGEREALMRRLGQSREDTPDALVARHARTVLEGLDRMDSAAHDIVIRHVRNTSIGMARWVLRGSDFSTEEDLDDYMHQVAGRVGHLITDLWTLRFKIRAGRDAVRELGREYGLGLQTVNVIRGLHKDRHRGWIFIPASFIPDPSLSAGDLFKPEHRETAMAVLSTLVKKAERHLDGARRYVSALPRRQHRVRVAAALPLLYAVRTLAITRSSPDVLDRARKMTRAEVISITRWTRLLGFSNWWLRFYCRRLASRNV